jgi:hypothetical protein
MSVVSVVVTYNCCRLEVEASDYGVVKDIGAATSKRSRRNLTGTC